MGFLEMLRKARGGEFQKARGGDPNHPQNWHAAVGNKVPGRLHNYVSREWDNSAQRWRYNYNYSGHAKLSQDQHAKLHGLMQHVKKQMNTGRFASPDVARHIASAPHDSETKMHAMKLMAGLAGARGNPKSTGSKDPTTITRNHFTGGWEAHHAVDEAIDSLEKHRPA